MPDRVDLGGGRGLGRYGDPVTDTYHDQTNGARAYDTTHPEED